MSSSDNNQRLIRIDTIEGIRFEIREWIRETNLPFDVWYVWEYNDFRYFFASLDQRTTYFTGEQWIIRVRHPSRMYIETYITRDDLRSEIGIINEKNLILQLSKNLMELNL